MESTTLEPPRTPEVPADTELVAPAATAPEPVQQPIVRTGLSGVIAELGQQRRANAQARFTRRESRRAAKTQRRDAIRNGTARGLLGRGYDSLCSAIGSAQGAGVQIGFVMALIGSAVGQLSWWANTLPLGLAVAFALTFEAIMIGAGWKARERRANGTSGAALRIIAWASAGAAAAFNWFHLSNPHTVLAVFSTQLNGSPELGGAFAAFTAAGFLVHELSANAAVSDRLREKGLDTALGARWLYLPSAVKTKLLMLDAGTPRDLAWEQVRATLHAKKAAKNAGKKAGTAPVDPAPVAAETAATAQHEAAADQTEEPATEQPTDRAEDAAARTADQDTPGAQDTPQPAEQQASRTLALVKPEGDAETTIEMPSIPASDWLKHLLPVARVLHEDSDWLSSNDVRRATQRLAPHVQTRPVGRRGANRILDELEADPQFAGHAAEQRGVDRPAFEKAIEAGLEALPAEFQAAAN